MNTRKSRSFASIIVTAAVLTTSAFAFAAPTRGDGEPRKDRGGHFVKADKNQDGFLTEAEVGAKRWEHLKLADANKDSKVSREELKEARKSGAMPHRGGCEGKQAS